MNTGFKRLSRNVAILILISSVAQGQSTPTSLARTMYARLTGVVPATDSSQVAQMASLISNGDWFGAAKVATGEDNFYNIVVRNMASTMSNRDLSVNVPLNDFIATFVGNVRDKLNVKDLLTGNYFYLADATKVPTPMNIHFDPVNDILMANTHYADLDTSNVNLRKTLMQMPQLILARSGQAVTHPEPAGLLTSRQWGSAHLRAGTNRRAVQFTFSQFLCMDIAGFADSGGFEFEPDGSLGIARDVDRNPQGDPSVFQTKCKSCHTMLDFMRPAFAHFDFIDLADPNFVRNTLVLDGNTSTNPNTTIRQNQIRTAADTGLAQKYYSNETVYPAGFHLQNTRWINHATSTSAGAIGNNAQFFGWRGSLTGNGLQQFAAMIANSQAFSRCMVKRVFASVCNRLPKSKYSADPNNTSDFSEDGLVQALADNFETNNYRIKGLFEQVAARPECLGN